MLILQMGVDWISGRDHILGELRQNVLNQQKNQILLVPELISHNMERLLCSWAGDTASRYAEVLTFRRLETRISEYLGICPREYLDNGGRLAAMALATKSLHSQIKVYAGMETKAEFLTELLDTVDELKQCLITAENLKRAAELTEGAFSQKLSDLALIMEAYDGICLQGKRDPRSRVDWTLEKLEECDYAKEHRLYIEGFPDFTRQHLAILEHFIMYSPEVTIDLCCDEPGSRKQGLEKAGQTAAVLLTFAKKHKIPVSMRLLPPRKDSFAPLALHALNGGVKEILPEKNTATMAFSSVYEECAAVMEAILRNVQNGERFREQGIVCADAGSYRPILELTAEKYGIPLYLSGTENILQRPVVVTLLSALEAAVGDLEQRDVLRYLKSSLSPLEMEDCDEIENYAIIWGIRGKKWFVTWENHPKGLDMPWSEDDRAYLNALNQKKDKALLPLQHLREKMKEAISVSQEVEAVNSFLEEIDFCLRLENMAQACIDQGDLRGAQIFAQLWEIILQALEQLYDTLGNMQWEEENFTRLLSLLLSQYQVGTIPAVLDSVTVGGITEMRGFQGKNVYVLGAKEGAFPSYSASGGLLTDRERIALREIGVPISGASLDKLQAELSDIYCVLAGAEKRLTMTVSGEQPSAIYRRLESCCPEKNCGSAVRGAMLADKWEAGTYLAGLGAEKLAQESGLICEYQQAMDKKGYTIGNLDRSQVEKLYGKKLRLSASQIDKMATCHMSYFLQYGLRAKQRKEIIVDPANFGSFVHEVMEKTAQRVMEMGGFHAVSLEETRFIAGKIGDKYIDAHFSELDSQRIRYLLSRSKQEVDMVVEELWEELSESEFAPAGFEVGFGDGEQMEPVDISGKTMPAILRGFVDRVDVYTVGDRHYFRVVDYKTGSKAFDYCDVYNGVGLQMLLYLFALKKKGMKIVGEKPEIAGVQYFPARANLISSDGELTKEEAQKERQKLWKRSGLLLRDDAILLAMENLPKPKRMQYTRNKDGELSGSLADMGQWRSLEQYVGMLLSELVDTIAEGSVKANPYTRDENHNPCRYCPYGSVCHSDCLADRRVFQKMDDKQFWDGVERKVKHGG